MVLLRRAGRETRWDAEPLTWWPVLSDGRRSAIIACSGGHAASITGHDIKADGTVHPSVVCPHEGCSWHVMARLEGWDA